MLVGEDLVVADGEVVVVHEAGWRAILAVRVQVAVAVAVGVAVGRQQQVGARAEDGAAAATDTVHCSEQSSAHWSVEASHSENQSYLADETSYFLYR